MKMSVSVYFPMHSRRRTAASALPTGGSTRQKSAALFRYMFGVKISNPPSASMSSMKPSGVLMI